MSPQKKQSIREWAPLAGVAVTVIIAAAGAIGTYAVTRATVADLKEASKEQARTNLVVAERLSAIEAKLQTPPQRWTTRTPVPSPPEN